MMEEKAFEISPGVSVRRFLFTALMAMDDEGDFTADKLGALSGYLRKLAVERADILLGDDHDAEDVFNEASSEVYFNSRNDFEEELQCALEGYV